MIFIKSSNGNSFLLLLSLLLALMVNVTVFGQTIIHVNAAAGSGGDGMSWGTAYNSLDTALSQATSGDQIWVAHGTYYPNNGGPGRASTFQIPYDISLYGGFTTSENDTTQRVNYGHNQADETILSGDGGISGNDTDNYYNVVTFESGDDYTNIFSGFTITKGNADGHNAYGYTDINSNDGGGILNFGSPRIENCTIIGNSADYVGGGIYNFAGQTTTPLTAVYIDCIISGNTSSGVSPLAEGGGIGNYATSQYFCEPKFINCIISGNFADDAGGVYNVWDNTSPTGDCNPEFVNCTITADSSSSFYQPEILNVETNCKPVFTNCIIWHDTVIVPTIENDYSAAPSFSYSIIEGSNGSTNWDPTYGSDGGNNLDVIPSFVTPLDPATAPSIAGDFHLQNGSYALDAGTPAYEIGTNDIPATDIEGNSRPLPSGAYAVDMGAYEENETLLPVELSSFSASVNGKSVALNWMTETEVNNFGFEVQRTSNLRGQGTQNGNGDLEGFKKIGFVKGHGNSNSPKQYSFTDNNPGTGLVKYRLKQIDNDGKFKYSKTVEVTLSAPTKFALEQNYPNPFNPTTKIDYKIAKPGLVSLKIYDALGREVATLVNGFKNPGSYTVQWNAEKFASGIYFYKIDAGKFSQVKKMILLK